MESIPNSENLIYTLVQSGTEKTTKAPQTTNITGVGTDITDTDLLKRKAKRKIKTQRTMLALIDIAKEKGEMERVGQYWRTYNCHSKLVLSDNVVYGNYCKNKFCAECNAIRKAEIINKYYPVLSEWEDVHFVTLTVKAPKSGKLKKIVNTSFRYMKRTLNRLKKRHQRGKGIKVMGIRSFECNFNPETKTYNPHFHLLVPNREVAQLLIDEWIISWRPKKGRKNFYAGRKGQNIRPLKNLESDLVETIKYGAKIITAPDKKKHKNLSTNPMIYAYALDNIYASIGGKHLFDRFGFNLPPQPKSENTEKTVKNHELWKYSINNTDWVNKDTGECLSGYSMPPELEHLLKECINKDIH